MSTLNPNKFYLMKVLHISRYLLGDDANTLFLYGDLNNGTLSNWDLVVQGVQFIELDNKIKNYELFQLFVFYLN
jgi:hypothetical protein